MFEFIRSHTKALMFVLVLLVIPSFVFWGIQGYSGFSHGRAVVAKVAGQAITQTDWDRAHRQQVERIRAQSPGVDATLLDTPQMKLQTLQQLVREHVMRVAANRLRLTVSDERLQRLFVHDPQLSFLRKPDGSVNTELLKMQGLTAKTFTEQLRQDYATRQVLGGISETALGAAVPAATALDALLQRREISIARFQAKNYRDQVKPTDAQITAYYNDPAHAQDFVAPEHAQIEYVVLDLAAIEAGIKVSDEDLRKYYDENAGRYTTPEERRARHILVKVDPKASPEERAKAKAKAEALLKEVRQNPSSFAEVAKKNSDDPGSAPQGGDLDWFGRGAMTKPFNDAVFAMKPGQISDLVKSDFGYHIIQLTDVRGGTKRTFEQARADVLAEVKQQLAQRKFSEAAETFSNTVYEQSDSLKPAADKLGLTVKTANDVTPKPKADTQGVLANPKFLAAVFSAESLRSKRNTEAVEIGPNQLAAARVLDYTPASRLPLEAIKFKVHDKIVAERSAALARKAALDKLAAWKGGAKPEGLEPPITISRSQSQVFPKSLIDAVMSAPANPLPGWTGVDFGDEGYAVVRIDKILPPDTSQGDTKRLEQEYAQIWGAAEAQAYYDALKNRYNVHIEITPASLQADSDDGGASSPAPN